MRQRLDSIPFNLWNEENGIYLPIAARISPLDSLSFTQAESSFWLSTPPEGTVTFISLAHLLAHGNITELFKYEIPPITFENASGSV